MKSMANRIRFKKNYHPHFGAMNCFFFQRDHREKEKKLSFKFWYQIYHKLTIRKSIEFFKT